MESGKKGDRKRQLEKEDAKPVDHAERKKVKPTKIRDKAGSSHKEKESVVEQAAAAPISEPVGVAPSSYELGSSILSDTKFESLDISEETKKAIREMGFERMTEVQAKTIPALLQV